MIKLGYEIKTEQEVEQIYNHILMELLKWEKEK